MLLGSPVKDTRQYYLSMDRQFLKEAYEIRVIEAYVPSRYMLSTQWTC